MAEPDIVHLGDSVTLYHGDCLEILPTLALSALISVTPV